MSVQSKLVLWLAQGFGIGRIPFMPGTFGSILGLGLLALLLKAQSWWVLIGGILLGTVASIWLCDRGEKLLNKKDPGSVVVDEVIAIPLSFLSWFAIEHPTLLSPAQLFQEHWRVVLGVFILFRIFDIGKPWPVGKSQDLPGGLGVTIDDVLAAGYVNVVVAVTLFVQHSLH